MTSIIKENLQRYYYKPSVKNQEFFDVTEENATGFLNSKFSTYDIKPYYDSLKFIECYTDEELQKHLREDVYIEDLSDAQKQLISIAVYNTLENTHGDEISFNPGGVYSREFTKCKLQENKYKKDKGDNNSYYFDICGLDAYYDIYIKPVDGEIIPENEIFEITRGNDINGGPKSIFCKSVYNLKNGRFEFPDFTKDNPFITRNCQIEIKNDLKDKVECYFKLIALQTFPRTFIFTETFGQPVNIPSKGGIYFTHEIYGNVFVKYDELELKKDEHVEEEKDKVQSCWVYMP